MDKDDWNSDQVSASDETIHTFRSKCDSLHRKWRTHHFKSAIKDRGMQQFLIQSDSDGGS